MIGKIAAKSQNLLHLAIYCLYKQADKAVGKMVRNVEQIRGFWSESPNIIMFLSILNHLAGTRKVGLLLICCSLPHFLAHLNGRSDAHLFSTAGLQLRERSFDVL